MARPQRDDRRCRWHPKHKQSTGVCPFCVREKLQLLNGSRFTACSSYSAYVFSSTASSSPCSDESDVSSSASSPRQRHDYVDREKRRTRVASHVTKGEAAESAKLKKSKSLVFSIGEHHELVMEERDKKGKEKEEEKEKRSKKKGMFWTRLLLSGSRRKEREEVAGVGVGGVRRGALRCSQTFKENASTTWAL